MSLTTIGIIGIVILVILLYSKMPVGFAMGFLGLIGFSYVVNFEAGLNLLVRDVWDVFSSYNLTVIPLFVFIVSSLLFLISSLRFFIRFLVVIDTRTSLSDA